MDFNINELVKKLREATQAGMMDCKKALVATEGKLEEAIDWLRKQGLSAAAKKSTRVASEGLVGVKVEGKKAALVEVNSETDFLSRNDKFQTLVSNITKIAIDCTDVEQLKTSNYPNSDKNVQEVITEHVAIIGENMNLRRMKNISIEKGSIVSYVHNSVTPELGKIAVLMALSASGEAVEKLGKQIAMHIAAVKPEALTIDQVDPANLEREKQIFSDQARSSGKPESIIEKMVEGRIRKYYEEIVLLEQIFIIDGKTKINDVLLNASKELDSEVKIIDFALFTLGAGIEKETTNFADEVKAVMSN